jgi:hypothetical protein
MGVRFVNASNHGLFTASNALSDIGGATDWAISYWAKMNEPTTDSGRHCFMVRVATNGFYLWHVAPASHGAARAYYEAYAPAGNIYQFTSSNFDAFYDDNWNHWMICKYSASEVAYYINGALIEVLSVATVVPGASTATLGIGNAGAYGTTRNPTIDMHDVRIYKDFSFTVANLAKLLYESRGHDTITDGLIGRWKLNLGTGTALAEADVSTEGNPIVTVQNAPNYIAAEIH